MKHYTCYEALTGIALNPMLCVSLLALVYVLEQIAHNVFGLGEGGEFNHKSLIER